MRGLRLGRVVFASAHEIDLARDIPQLAEVAGDSRDALEVLGVWREHGGSDGRATIGKANEMDLAVVYLIAMTLKHGDVEREYLVDMTLPEDTVHAACAYAEYDGVVEVLPNALIQLPVAEIAVAEDDERISRALCIMVWLA